MAKVAKNRTCAWVKYATTGAPKVRVGPLEQVWPPPFQDPGYATDFARALGMTHMLREYPILGRRDAATLQKLPQVNRPSGC